MEAQSKGEETRYVEIEMVKVELKIEENPYDIAQIQAEGNGSRDLKAD